MIDWSIIVEFLTSSQRWAHTHHKVSRYKLQILAYQTYQNKIQITGMKKMYLIEIQEMSYLKKLKHIVYKQILSHFSHLET